MEEVDNGKAIPEEAGPIPGGLKEQVPEEVEVEVPQKTRGGWQLNQIMGLTPEREEELFKGISETLKGISEELNNKEGLEKLIKIVDDMPIDEALTVLLFFGRWLGHIEYEARQKSQQGSLGALLQSLGKDATVLIATPEGVKEVPISDLVKGGI